MRPCLTHHYVFVSGKYMLEVSNPYKIIAAFFSVRNTGLHERLLTVGMVVVDVVANLQS